ncbi:MAG: DNRLRE domain-containing protein [Planctomycetota bacterium]
MQAPVLSAVLLSCLAAPAAAQTFTVVGIPDTQNYSESFPQIYYDQTQWVASSITALNIAFVNHYGDLVQHGDIVAEWLVADQAQATIDATGIPNSVTPGNHDVLPNGSSGESYIPQNYQAFFAPSRYSHQPWWGGASPTGMSSYQIWTGGGRSFVSLSVEVDTPLHELAWAQGVLDRHRDKPVIFTTHRYLQDAEDYTAGVPLVPSGRYPDIWYLIEDVYTPNGIQSEELWNWFLRRNPSIFMVNCGHFHEEFRQTSTNVYGHPVHEVLADYQDDPNGGNGWLRYYTIDIDADRIEAESYSPWLDEFRSAGESKFTLTTDFSNYATDNPARVFQQGINAYAGTQDTWINEAEPDTSYGESSVRVSDDDIENFVFGDYQAQALVRFDDVFGSGAIPSGANIVSATLSLELSNDIDNPLFDADFFVHRVLVPWDEGSTWNSLGNGLQVGSELTSAFASFDGDNSPDSDFLRRIDVTSSVQAWSDGSANWGFAILPEIISGNDDGIEIRTSESSIEILRPRLEVIYEEPCGASQYGLGAGLANVMELTESGTPAVGGVLVAVTGLAPDAPVTTLLSLGEASLDLLGGKVLIDPAQILLQSTDVPSAGGNSDWILHIPDDGALVGLDVYLQSFAADASQPAGLALSNGLKVTICQ